LLDGLRVNMNDLRPGAVGGKAGGEHQLGHGFDRWRIGTREAARVPL
jgi:hypothetical protein